MGTDQGHRPDIQPEELAQIQIRDWSCPASTLLGTDPAFAQVPRAFVNLVKTLQIFNLRELYQESNVSCPRLILR